MEIITIKSLLKQIRIEVATEVDNREKHIAECKKELKKLL